MERPIRQNAAMQLQPLMPFDPERVLVASDVPRVAENALALGRRFIVVDGFTGAGTSTLAEALADRLAIRWIELDDFLSEDLEIQSYIERVNREFLGKTLSATFRGVIDGILAGT
jgi:hypothetical protein